MNSHNPMSRNHLPLWQCLLILGLIGGCESPGAANPMPPEAEREQVAAALASVATGHESQYELEAAGGRGVWEDVPNAVRWAIAEEGVEMGLVSTHALVDGYTFRLITVEGWPASLTVRRTFDSRVYAASAEVGRFHEVLDRGDRAAALVRAFDEWMAALGAKPRLVPKVD